MRLPSRSLLAAAVLAPLLAATAPAHAITCNVLVDPVGDASPAASAAVPSSPDLDIISADVASSSTAVAGVLRVRSLQTSPLTTLGAQWSLRWEINGTPYVLIARRDVNGAYTASTGGGFVPQQLAFAVNATNSSFTWHTLRSSLPDLPATTGTAVFDHISASTAVSAGVATTNADAATTSGTYLDGTPSCVKV
ncbi:MAG TPA: hypothetical protein VFQ85_12585 [Mycobacteriales bacterium]|jgi:hypothetical protein|nr:hypothetical protein [Mycobacteriales bacterium]